MKRLFLLLVGLLLCTNLGFSQAPQYGRFHKSLYGSAAPSVTPCLDGTLYYSSTYNKLYTCESSAWVDLVGTLVSPIIQTSIILDAATADYTFTWANPAAARAISIVDPLGTDVFVWRDASQTLTNKTLTSPVLNTPTVGTSITPVTAGGSTAGTTALPFSSAYIGGAATNNFRITGTATGARVFTLQDTASDTFAMINASQTFTQKTLTSPVLNTATVGTSIAPTSAGGATGGTLALPFSSVYVGGAATNNFQITGTATGTRVFTLLDTASDTFVMLNATQTLAAKTFTAPLTIANTGATTYGIEFNGATLTNDVRFTNSSTLSRSSADAWSGLTLTKSTTVGPTVGNESIAFFVENNRTAVIDDQATLTAIEGAARAQGAGRSLTLRGGHFRTYIDETYAGADAITSVGVDGSVRASGAVVAHDGTAFVGVRSYMSPGFTAGSLAFVTNSHAFWAYNEHATNAVTNVLYNSDAGGGFTYGVNMSGGTIGTADILFSNSQTLAAVANGKELDIFDDAQTTAAGGSKLNVRSSSLTNALTGEQNAIRARSENRVASMTGAINGAYIQAANYEDSAAGDMRGTYLEILLKGKDIAVARGLEVVVDSDDSETIATELAGVAINMQTGSSQTYSGIATGLRIRNAGVAGGGGKLLDSFIRLDSESNQIGATVLIDASAAKETAQAGNIVCLMSFKDSAGTARWLIYDVDAVAAVSVSAACP